MTAETIERLSPVDLINVAVESPTSPARVGAIAILDGRTLVDADRQLRLADIRAELHRRIAGVPRLRQAIHRGGPLSGRPVWVDDPSFRIERHINEVALPSGAALEDLAIDLINQPLDGSHPLWRMWFVTALPGGRIALVLALHHVVADGVTTVELIRSLTDGPQPLPTAAPGFPRPAARWRELVRDNIRRRGSALRHWRVPALSQWRSVAGVRNALRTSLNQPIGAHRRLAWVSVDLADAKRIARRHSAKVNDLVLALAGAGLRELLAGRGERVDGVVLNASVAVSLRAAGQDDVGNRSGGIVVRVPLDGDPERRLREIAADSRRAKASQVFTTGNSMLIGLARLGLLKFFSRRQHMVNFVESNVAGPDRVLRLMGAPILRVVPVGSLVGNLTVGVLALSYAGCLTVAVQADADRCPDLPMMIEAMRREVGQLVPAQRPIASPAR